MVSLDRANSKSENHARTNDEKNFTSRCREADVSRKIYKDKTTHE